MKSLAVFLFGALVGALLEDELWYRKMVYRESLRVSDDDTALCA